MKREREIVVIAQLWLTCPIFSETLCVIQFQNPDGALRESFEHLEREFSRAVRRFNCRWGGRRISELEMKFTPVCRVDSGLWSVGKELKCTPAKRLIHWNTILVCRLLVSSVDLFMIRCMKLLMELHFTHSVTTKILGYWPSII